MLIGKLHLLLLLTGFFFVGCTISETKTDNLKPEEAWWISEEFKSTDIDIYGIPVSQINPDWRHALILNKKYYESLLSDNQFKNIRESNLVFTVEANLDGTPEIETFFVGVYETYSGQRGRFIAIMRNSEVIKYFTHTELSGYSSIYLENDQLRWYKCMECSDFDSIRWSGSSYTLQ